MSKHKMEIDWCNGLKNNAALLLEEDMWEQSYGVNSTFLSYYMNPPKGKYSTLLYYIGKKLVGVLIFPHFPIYVETVSCNKDVKYCSIGEIQLYVKPEYRNQGIAKAMILEFSKELEDTVKQVKQMNGNDVVPIIQSVDLAHKLSKKYLPNYFHFDYYGFEPNKLKWTFQNVQQKFVELTSYTEKEKSA